MSHIVLYFIVKLDTIIGVLGGIAVVSWVSFCAVAIIYAMQYSEAKDYNNCDYRNEQLEQIKPLRSVRKKLMVIAIIATVFATFLPNTKQLAFIYITPKAVDAITGNEELMKLPNSAFKLLNAKMEEYIAESLAKTEKEKK